MLGGDRDVFLTWKRRKAPPFPRGELFRRRSERRAEQGGDTRRTRSLHFPRIYPLWRRMFNHPTRAKTWPVGLGSGRPKANQNRSPRPVGLGHVASTVGKADGAARGPLPWTGVGTTHRRYRRCGSLRADTSDPPHPAKGRRSVHKPASSQPGVVGRPDVLANRRFVASRKPRRFSMDPTEESSPFHSGRGGRQSVTVSAPHC
jgi:hypothetical protein